MPSYREGFGDSPLVSECSYWEGTILLRKGRTGEAERLFETTIGRPRSTWFQAAAWVGIGDCRFTIDDYRGAAQAYQRSLDLGVQDARNDYALYRLGVARQRAGDWEAGKACYQIVVRDYAKSALRTRAEQRLRYPDCSLHLQVGAFQSEEGARKLETLLHGKGMIARTVHITGGAAPYLVWVGDYASIAHAQTALAQVKALCGDTVVLVP
jgi:tetratricopeptide (TPR) repeat protein